MKVNSEYKIVGKRYLIEIFDDVKELRVSDFLPDMIYIGIGDIEKNVERLKLATNPCKFSKLAVVDATLALTVCPLCEGSISKGAYVIVTESHNIFPCWNCEEFAILDLEVAH